MIIIGDDMKVEVLGPGCTRCDQLYANTKKAAAELGSPAGVDVQKVTDINYFTKMVLMYLWKNGIS